MSGTAPGSAQLPAARLDGLALCFRLHANLARAAALLPVDHERAGWFLVVAEAALARADAPLPVEVLCELRRLVEAALQPLREGDIPAAESSVALAEGLCVVSMLRRETAPERRPAA